MDSFISTIINGGTDFQDLLDEQTKIANSKYLARRSFKTKDGFGDKSERNVLIEVLQNGDGTQNISFKIYSLDKGGGTESEMEVKYDSRDSSMTMLIIPQEARARMGFGLGKDPFYMDNTTYFELHPVDSEEKIPELIGWNQTLKREVKIDSLVKNTDQVSFKLAGFSSSEQPISVSLPRSLKYNPPQTTIRTSP